MRGLYRSVAVVLLLLSAENLSAADGWIRGIVVDTDGSPIEDVNVSVADNGSAVSDSAGLFFIGPMRQGEYTVEFSHIAFETAHRSLEVGDIDGVVEVVLEARIIGRRVSIIDAERDRSNRIAGPESPLSHTILNAAQIEEIRTTGDLPELLAAVPGVWSSSAGLGEADMTVRGFASDQVSYSINGIPMNEPENRSMDWSDWSGLAGMVDAIHAVGGPMAISPGSGSFGGAVEFHTREPDLERLTRIRLSTGIFHTAGATSGANKGLVATGTGSFSDRTTARHLVATAEIHSGPILDGRARVAVIGERKIGDSSIQGTGYDGAAFSVQGVGIFGSHELALTFMGSPQTHDQAEVLQDPSLLKTLGHEYNHVNHPWRFDESFRPALSFRDRWQMTDHRVLTSEAYITTGGRTGSRLINGTFDVATGKVGFQPVALSPTDYSSFGRHARYIHEEFGIQLVGYTPRMGEDPPLFNNHPINPETPAHLLTQQKSHSWQSAERHEHRQIGFSTQLDGATGGRIDWLAGIGGQLWTGNRSSRADLLRVAESANSGLATMVTNLSEVYNYDTHVRRTSGFARVVIHLTDSAALHLGGDITAITKSVDENPIGFFDFERSINQTTVFFSRERAFHLRTSADRLLPTGENRFKRGQYERNFLHASPWIGLIVTPQRGTDLYINAARSVREPAIADWYDPDAGPRVEGNAQDLLDVERVRNVEFGLRHSNSDVAATLGYYHAQYSDKIESVVDELSRRQTLNAGAATHQGVEVSIRGAWPRWSLRVSGALARNRWQEMAVEEIFGAPASDVVGKVVPFSPELSGSARADYRMGAASLGASLSWWDRYFGTFTNDYVDTNGRTRSSQLPAFVDLGIRMGYRLGPEDHPVSVRLDVNNLLNRRDNFQRARLAVDETRNDSLAGVPTWYVLQAPLLNTFVTVLAEF